MTHKPLATRFHLLLLGVLAALTAVGFVKIPSATGLPVHWGPDGQPDQIWPRDSALVLLPVLAVVITGIIAALGRWAPEEQVEPGRHVAETALAGVLGVFCALQFALILIGTGSDIDVVRIISFLLAVLLLVLGNALPKSQPNAYAGVRLPWTMKDPANWQATHWLTGLLMIASGLALAAVAWLRPDPRVLIVAVLLAMFVPILAGAIFSFVKSRFSSSKAQ